MPLAPGGLSSINRSIKEAMMEASEIELMRKKVAQLEFSNDQLASELAYVDDLLRAIGFDEGLASVKEAAIEVLRYEDGC